MLCWNANSQITGSAGILDRVQRIMDACQGVIEPSILAIMAKIRQEVGLSIRMRAAMVCRGLPVHNLLAEKV